MHILYDWAISSGITFVGGAMRCPKEDGNGNSRYEVLDVLGHPPALAAACRERSRSMNYINRL